MTNSTPNPTPSEFLEDTVIVVPCRLKSERFPRKLLHEVLDRPLILWTAERITEQTPEFPLYFAVEDTELADFLANRGYKVIKTSPNHQSGTDRIAEANEQIKAKNVINVQGDEPLVSAEQIRALANLIHGPADLATLANTITEQSDFEDSNQVKVVIDQFGHALYFSRAPIPYDRDCKGHIETGKTPVYRHLGMYAYSAEFLSKFGSLQPTKLEQIEKLEQLRALENGFQIAVGISNQATIGVDTPEDAKLLEDKFLESL